MKYNENNKMYIISENEWSELMKKYPHYCGYSCVDKNKRMAFKSIFDNSEGCVLLVEGKHFMVE